MQFRAETFSVLVALMTIGFSSRANSEVYEYKNSSKENILLETVEDRVFVVFREENQVVPTLPFFEESQPLKKFGPFVELRVRSKSQVSVRQIHQTLLEQKIIQRHGLAFKTTSGKIFGLDRGLIVRLKSKNISFENWLRKFPDIERLDWLSESRNTLLLTIKSAPEVFQVAKNLLEQEDVLWAVPDFIVNITLHHRPNDPFYEYQWYLNQRSSAHIHAEAAWEITHGDPRVRVGVFDTGVEITHPDFETERILPGFNTVDSGSNVTPGASTIDAHGTACAGEILASFDNQEGIAGVCPKCSLLPVKFGDGTTLSGMAAGFQFLLEEDAWVVSNSWGIVEEEAHLLDMRPLIQAIQELVLQGRGGKGTLVLFASGNRGRLIGDHELARLPEIIAVGGTSLDDQWVAYSCFGPNLSVVAPTGPATLGPATKIFTLDTLGDRGFSREGISWMPNEDKEDFNTGIREPDPTGNYTAFFTGTSAACPIAAGVAALIFSTNPDLTGEQARLILEQTADKVGGDSYDPEGWNQKYGHGRVNAARAVLAVSFGFDLPDFHACAEDFNCGATLCKKGSPDDSTGFCGPVCFSKAECEGNQECVLQAEGHSICTEVCENHEACAEPAICKDATCQEVACEKEIACPTGTACPFEEYGSSLCEKTCEDDDFCIPPALCLSAIGGDLCQAIECSPTVLCPNGTQCIDGKSHCARTCQSDQECQKPALCFPAGVYFECQTKPCDEQNPCPEKFYCGEENLCLRDESTIGLIGSCSCHGIDKARLGILQFVLMFFGAIFLKKSFRG